MIQRGSCVVVALIAACMVQGVGAAEAYPSRPVRFIVPYPPGGGSDIIGRTLSERLASSLGQTFIVDNRPGATSLIGTEIAARAAPDGHTLLLADSPHTINSVVYRKPKYDAIRDFSAIVLVATSPQTLLAHPSFPASSLRELLAMPRSQTERFAYGTSGLASVPHMVYEWLRVRTGLTLNHVPYKGGGPALADAVAGQIPLLMNSMPAAMPHVRAARLKALALTSRERHPLLPSTPTFIESGVADMVTWQWYGVLAPAGLRREIVDTLNREIQKVMASREVQERFTALGLDAAPGNPEAFLALLKSEDSRWRALMKEVRIELD